MSDGSRVKKRLSVVVCSSGACLDMAGPESKSFGIDHPVNHLGGRTSVESRRNRSNILRIIIAFFKISQGRKANLSSDVSCSAASQESAGLNSICSQRLGRARRGC